MRVALSSAAGSSLSAIVRLTDEVAESPSALREVTENAGTCPRSQFIGHL
jgi:hypothetical protein